MANTRYDPQRALADFPSRIEAGKGVKRQLNLQVARIREFQETLFADRTHALLLVFQGMDCAGKDSTIKHVLTGVNPQGISVTGFREPTHNETAHSYLWRYWRAMPRRGMIGVFNRSHYEEVLVMRVVPELFEQRRMPHPNLDAAFWAQRFDDIRAMEAHLHNNGIHILKFFLNLSKEEQRRRLLGRIDRPHKRWKFDPRDMSARAQWDQYREAYAQAIAATHTADSPWHIIPADHKPTMRALVAEVIADKLSTMPIAIPDSETAELEVLMKARADLLAETQPSSA
ncbi:MAG: PPK2 family polyphosphate kinase [Pseudomonadota bacterium]